MANETPVTTHETTQIEDEDELHALWLAYRSEPSNALLREQLILHYAPLVNRVVGRMGLHPSGAIEWNDLVNYGILGLMDAVERFEPERGITFSTFASLRIRGAVLDALRQMDPLGRLARRRVREAKESIQTLTMQLGRAPEDHEVAAEIGVSEEQYRQVLQDANFMILSLDQPLRQGSGDQKLRLGDLLEDPSATSTLEKVEESELQERLAQAIQSLPKREQILLSLYYYEDLTMREVADVMDISQTRVCQLHARAVMTLRAMMTPSPREKDPTHSNDDQAQIEAQPINGDRRNRESPVVGLDRRRSSYRANLHWTQRYNTES